MNHVPTYSIKEIAEDRDNNIKANLKKWKMIKQSLNELWKHIYKCKKNKTDFKKTSNISETNSESTIAKLIFIATKKNNFSYHQEDGKENK